MYLTLQLTAEHEHTVRILEITKENQNALAAELADAKVTDANTLFRCLSMKMYSHLLI